MKRWTSGALLSAIFLFVMAGPAPHASAAPALVAVDDTGPSLATAANGWTVPAGLTNLTNAPVNISAAPTVASASCKLTPTPAVLPAAEHASVTVAIPASCSVKDGFDFTITASSGTASSGTASQQVTIKAGKAATPKTDWSPLQAFVISFVILFVLAAVASLAYWSAKKEKMSLPYLGATWSFSDSWVNNITVGAGLLTGIFGSTDVVKALIGKDADQATALAVVAAAIAAAFIAAAPLILGVLKDLSGNVTVHGLFFAAAFTLTGAFGELWSLGKSALHLDIKGLTQFVTPMTVTAMVLLAVYAVRALVSIVDVGSTEPPDPKKHAQHAATTISKIRLAAAGRNLQTLDADDAEQVTIGDTELKTFEDAAWLAADAATPSAARGRSALL